jgi:hypothetical protein
MEPIGSAAIVIGMLGAVVLKVLPKPCECDLCATHSKERRDQREAKRLSSHRAIHSNWGIPWGSERCTICARGHEGDRET